MWLRGLTIVELEQAAETLTTCDLACPDRRFPLRDDDLVTETPVWPFLMVMVDKFPDGRSEMSFAERHHAV